MLMYFQQLLTCMFSCMISPHYNLNRAISDYPQTLLADSFVKRFLKYSINDEFIENTCVLQVLEWCRVMLAICICCLQLFSHLKKIRYTWGRLSSGQWLKICSSADTHFLPLLVLCGNSFAENILSSFGKCFIPLFNEKPLLKEILWMLLLSSPELHLYGLMQPVKALVNSQCLV